MELVRREESESHRHQSESLQGVDLPPSAEATACGVKRRRVKKYGFGSAFGSRNAADALRDESGEEPKAFVRASPPANSARSGRGKRCAAAATRETLEVERNGL